MRRTVPNRLGLYDDVRQILDAALAAGGGVYSIPVVDGDIARAHGAAVHWRQRAYKFRKLYAQTIANDNTLAMSPYDKLSMKMVAPNSSDVVITVRQLTGTFKPNNEPYASSVEPEDELFDVARQIADKIAKGEM